MEKNKKESVKEFKLEEDQKGPLIHDFNSQTLKSSFTPKVTALLVLVIILGVVTGFFVSGDKTSSSSPVGSVTSVLTGGSSVPKGTIVGSNDTKTFSDTAEGVLQVGGIKGDGAYHLVRSGGSSQYVYLTSSIVDLSKYVNMKIKVWGQTQKAQYAGWLMDVGRIEVE